MSELEELIKIVNIQAGDRCLWFKAETAPEAYLQAQLRRLHYWIEQARQRETGELDE